MVRTSGVAVLALSIVVLSGVACAGVARAESLPDPNVANEGEIADDWKLADGASIVAPPYPAEYDNDARPDACIALKYTIYPDGTTGDFRVLRKWKNGPASHTEMRPFWLKFARASAAAVGQWRFAPRDPANPRPTTTVATLSFFGNTVVDAKELRAHCTITDLAVLLRDLERRDTLVAKLIERDNRARDRAYRIDALTPGPAGRR